MKSPYEIAKVIAALKAMAAADAKKAKAAPKPQPKPPTYQ